MVVRPDRAEKSVSQQKADPHHTDKVPNPPDADGTSKQVQREKAEVKEVAGRHKNDGQAGHKGRR